MTTLADIKLEQLTVEELQQLADNLYVVKEKKEDIQRKAEAIANKEKLKEFKEKFLLKFEAIASKMEQDSFEAAFKFNAETFQGETFSYHTSFTLEEQGDYDNITTNLKGESKKLIENRLGSILHQAGIATVPDFANFQEEFRSHMDEYADAYVHKLTEKYACKFEFEAKLSLKWGINRENIKDLRRAYNFDDDCVDYTFTLEDLKAGIGKKELSNLKKTIQDELLDACTQGFYLFPNAMKKYLSYSKVLSALLKDVEDNGFYISNMFDDEVP